MLICLQKCPVEELQPFQQKYAAESRAHVVRWKQVQTTWMLVSLLTRKPRKVLVVSLLLSSYSSNEQIFEFSSNLRNSEMQEVK